MMGSFEDTVSSPIPDKGAIRHSTWGGGFPEKI